MKNKRQIDKRRKNRWNNNNNKKIKNKFITKPSWFNHFVHTRSHLDTVKPEGKEREISLHILTWLI